MLQLAIQGSQITRNSGLMRLIRTLTQHFKKKKWKKKKRNNKTSAICGYKSHICVSIKLKLQMNGKKRTNYVARELSRDGFWQRWCRIAMAGTITRSPPPKKKCTFSFLVHCPELFRTNRLIFHCESLNKIPPGSLNQCHCQQCLGFLWLFYSQQSTVTLGAALN